MYVQVKNAVVEGSKQSVLYVPVSDAVVETEEKWLLPKWIASVGGSIIRGIGSFTEELIKAHRYEPPTLVTAVTKLGERIEELAPKEMRLSTYFNTIVPRIGMEVAHLSGDYRLYDKWEQEYRKAAGLPESEMVPYYKVKNPSIDIKKIEELVRERREAPERPESFVESLVRIRRELGAPRSVFYEQTTADKIGKVVSDILEYPEIVIGTIFGLTGASIGELTRVAGRFTGVDSMRELGAEMSRRYEAFQSLMYPDDPNFPQKLVGSVASLGTFYFGGKLITSPIQKAKFISNTVKNYGTLAGMTVLESAVEAGSVYNQVYRETGDEGTAHTAANKAFILNAAILGLSNKFFLESMGRGIGPKLRAGIPEMIQEREQTAIEHVIADRVPPPEESIESAILGYLSGVIGASTIPAIERRFTRREVAKEIDKLLDEVQTASKVEKVEEDAIKADVLGIIEEQAKIDKLQESIKIIKETHKEASETRNNIIKVYLKLAADELKYDTQYTLQDMLKHFDKNVLVRLVKDRFIIKDGDKFYFSKERFERYYSKVKLAKDVADIEEAYSQLEEELKEDKNLQMLKEEEAKKTPPVVVDEESVTPLPPFEQAEQIISRAEEVLDTAKVAKAEIERFVKRQRKKKVKPEVEEKAPEPEAAQPEPEAAQPVPTEIKATKKKPAPKATAKPSPAKVVPPVEPPKVEVEPEAKLPEPEAKVKPKKTARKAKDKDFMPIDAAIDLQTAVYIETGDQEVKNNIDTLRKMRDAGHTEVDVDMIYVPKEAEPETKSKPKTKKKAKKVEEEEVVEPVEVEREPTKAELEQIEKAAKPKAKPKVKIEPLANIAPQGAKVISVDGKRTGVVTSNPINIGGSIFYKVKWDDPKFGESTIRHDALGLHPDEPGVHEAYAAPSSGYFMLSDPVFEAFIDLRGETTVRSLLEFIASTNTPESGLAKAILSDSKAMEVLDKVEYRSVLLYGNYTIGGAYYRTGTHPSMNRVLLMKIGRFGNDKTVFNVFLHEVAHALTADAISRNHTFRKQIDSIKSIATQHLPDKIKRLVQSRQFESSHLAYHFTDAYEFMAGIFDKSFRTFLDSIKYPEKPSILGTIKNLIAKYVLNLKTSAERSLLDDLLDVYEDLFNIEIPTMTFKDIVSPHAGEEKYSALRLLRDLEQVHGRQNDFYSKLLHNVDGYAYAASLLDAYVATDKQYYQSIINRGVDTVFIHSKSMIEASVLAGIILAASRVNTDSLFAATVQGLDSLSLELEIDDIVSGKPGTSGVFKDFQNVEARDRIAAQLGLPAHSGRWTDFDGLLSMIQASLDIIKNQRIIDNHSFNSMFRGTVSLADALEVVIDESGKFGQLARFLLDSKFLKPYLKTRLRKPHLSDVIEKVGSKLQFSPNFYKAMMFEDALFIKLMESALRVIPDSEKKKSLSLINNLMEKIFDSLPYGAKLPIKQLYVGSVALLKDNISFIRGLLFDPAFRAGLREINIGGKNALTVSLETLSKVFGSNVNLEDYFNLLDNNAHLKMALFSNIKKQNPPGNITQEVDIESVKKRKAYDDALLRVGMHLYRQGYKDFKTWRKKMEEIAPIPEGQLKFAFSAVKNLDNGSRQTYDAEKAYGNPDEIGYISTRYGVPKIPLSKGITNMLDKIDRPISISLFDSAYFAFRKIDDTFGTNLTDTVRRPAEIAHKNARLKVLARMDKVQEIVSKHKLGMENFKNVMSYAIMRQEGGKEALERTGQRQVDKLTPQEQELYDFMRECLEQDFKDFNEARRLVGLKPIEGVTNYFTWQRLMTDIMDDGLAPIHVSQSEIDNRIQYIRAFETPMPYAKERVKGAKQKFEMNSIKVFHDYQQKMQKYIHLTPVLAKTREMINYMNEKKITAKAPAVVTYLSEYVNFEAGIRRNTILGSYKLRKTIDRLTKNLSDAIMIYNFKVALTQLASLDAAAAELGVSGLKAGLEAYLDKNRRKASYEKSNIMLIRSPETAFMEGFMEIVYTYTKGKDTMTESFRAIYDAIKKTGYKPIQIMDYFIANVTWHGAYETHLAKGYPEDIAIKYADDMVLKTQASGASVHIAPIQKDSLGKAITLFGTFVINRYNWLKYDIVFPIAKGNYQGITRREAFTKLLIYYLVAAAMDWLFEEVIGVVSPNPTPIKEALRQYEEKGEEHMAIIAGLAELMTNFPIVGNIRYGHSPFGPVVSYGAEVFNWIKQGAGYTLYSPPFSEFLFNGVFLAAKGFGVPLTHPLSTLYKGVTQEKPLQQWLLGGSKREPGLLGEALVY